MWRKALEAVREGKRRLVTGIERTVLERQVGHSHPAARTEIVADQPVAVIVSTQWHSDTRCEGKAGRKELVRAGTLQIELVAILEINCELAVGDSRVDAALPILVVLHRPFVSELADDFVS